MNDEIQMVYKLITHPAGFDVGNSGILNIRRYEYPVWAVEWEIFSSDRYTEVKEFEDPMEAATFFIHKRYEMYLGLDLEVENK